MERKVFGACAVGLMLLALVSPARAGGGGAVTGGSTEITQLLNNFELVAQVGEAVATTANTLQTAQATIQMLRNLSPASLAQMAGLPIGDLTKLAQAYTVFSQAHSVYKDAAGVLNNARNLSLQLNLSPSELLMAGAKASKAFGGVYKDAYESSVSKLENLNEVSKSVQEQAYIVRSIDSTVGGIQTLASQNLQVMSLMTGMSADIARANSLAALEKEQEYNEKRIQQERDAKAYEQYKENLMKSTQDSNAMDTTRIFR